MVSMNVSDATIDEYLDKNPAVLYEPRIEPDLSVDPIITVKSQPLPDFGLDPTLISRGQVGRLWSSWLTMVKVGV
jgi:serine/threonine-protein kinase SRPK3